jgi:hypothetical protein
MNLLARLAPIRRCCHAAVVRLPPLTPLLPLARSLILKKQSCTYANSHSNTLPCLHDPKITQGQKNHMCVKPVAI